MKIKGIKISHPDKILFPEEGITKKQVAQYYDRIADHLLPHGQMRPLTFHSFPEGITEDGFFNKNMPDHYPDFIPSVEVPTRSDNKPDAIMAAAEKPEDLIYFAGQNTIELHASLSGANALEEPDRMVFDFDPSDDDFDKVLQLVRSFEELLDDLEISAFLNTTGSRGLHVHIPLSSGGNFDQSKEVAHTLAEKLRHKEPDISTLEQRKNKRGNKVFIDSLRNAYGQTFVVPYSLRAKEYAPVATPVRWAELEASDFSSQKYTLTNIFHRISQTRDPWHKFVNCKQSLKTLQSKIDGK